MEQEIWFEIQYSLKGADDWFSSATTADTQEAILEKMQSKIAHQFEFRIVKKTLTTEVIKYSEV